MKRATRLLITYLLLNIYQPLLIAGAPIVSVKNLSGAITIPKNATASMNIQLTQNPSTPSALSFVLSNTLPSGVSMVTQGLSPCPSVSTLCGSSFSLSPGGHCCLSLSLDASKLNVGANTFNLLFRGGVAGQPVPNPSAFPFQTGSLKVTVTANDEFFTVTPTAGVNGTISPSTPQSVAYGNSVIFTAAGNQNYVVDQWLVNATPAQVGGSNFTLDQVTSDTAVSVTFSQTPPAQLSRTPTTLSFTAGSSTAQSVTVTNQSTVTTVENLAASIPGGSSVTISSQDCSSTLSPQTNCTYSFLPGNTVGSTEVTIAGSNTTTPAATVSITTSAPPTTTITASSPRITLAYPQGQTSGSGSVIIINTGTTNPALNVQADLSGLTCTSLYTNISATTCPSIAANGGTCTITFTTQSPNSVVCLPGSITISGSNTASALTENMAFTIANYYIFALNADSSATATGTAPQGLSTAVTSNLAFDSSCSSMPPYNCDTNWTTGADSLYDGVSNTLSIISQASASSQLSDVQAANQCNDIISDDTGVVPPGTWYLPAVCQMSLSINGSIGTCTNAQKTTILHLRSLGFVALNPSLQLWTSSMSIGVTDSAYLEEVSIPSGYRSGMQAAISVICTRGINPGD